MAGTMPVMAPRSLTRRAALVWLASLALPAAAAKPPSMMHAREAVPGLDPAGFLVSEKYDGVRAAWDGHTLRFRSGLTVVAPGWFTARLPHEPLDGELWLGRGTFEALSGIVRRTEPVDADWRQLRYMVFDQPGTPGPFAERAARLTALAQRLGWPALSAVPQERLEGVTALQRRLDAVVAGGGEGLVLHRADATWQPGRSHVLWKLKPLDDAEAVVVGHLAGRGRHASRMGALRVRTPLGVEFLIGTGFTDAQRATPPSIGTVVTYTHRGRTAGGVPRFASFLRVRAP